MCVPPKKVVTKVNVVVPPTIGFLGTVGSGKTSLINILGSFILDDEDSYAAFLCKEIMVPINRKLEPYKIVKITAESQFESMIKLYEHSCDLMIGLFDLTSIDSFNALINYMLSMIDRSRKHNKFLLIGNKVDLADHRAVNSLDAIQFAKTLNIMYIEISCSTNHPQSMLTDIFNRYKILPTIRVEERVEIYESCNL